MLMTDCSSKVKGKGTGVGGQRSEVGGQKAVGRRPFLWYLDTRGEDFSGQGMGTIEIGCPENMGLDSRVKLPSEFHKLYLKVERINYLIENEGNVDIAVCAG